MATQRIRQLGDPVLRQRSRETTPREAAPVAADLRDTLHEFQRAHSFGRGIAAIQVGQPLRLIYLEFGGQEYVLLNPVCEESSPQTIRLWDDCFSFPDLLALVERSTRVRVRYQDLEGREQRLTAEGALAELLQHELDHLDGVLAVDRAIGRDGLCTRAEYLRRQRAAAAGRD